MPYRQQVQHSTNYLLSVLNQDATISTHNNLHLPMGARIVEFKHISITSKSQLPIDIPIERHAWVRIGVTTQTNENSPRTLTNLAMDPKLLATPSFLNSTQWILSSHHQCSAHAFATDDTLGIGGWVTIH